MTHLLLRRGAACAAAKEAKARAVPKPPIDVVAAAALSYTVEPAPAWVVPAKGWWPVRRGEV